VPQVLWDASQVIKSMWQSIDAEGVGDESLSSELPYRTAPTELLHLYGPTSLSSCMAYKNIKIM